jgi:hypothetical protein
MKNDNNKNNKRETWRLAIRLLERLLTRANRAQKMKKVGDLKWVEYAWYSRISWKSSSGSRQSRDSAEKRAT